MLPRACCHLQLMHCDFSIRKSSLVPRLLYIIDIKIDLRYGIMHDAWSRTIKCCAVKLDLRSHLWLSMLTAVCHAAWLLRRNVHGGYASSNMPRQSPELHK